MKKLLQGILIISLFLGISNVKAENLEDIYFTNKNNVSFTKFQYDVVVDAFGLSGLLNMDLEQYTNIEIGMMTEADTKVTVLEDHDVEKEDENEGISTFDSKYNETAYKKLTGITTCKSGIDYCLLTVVSTWKKNPSTRSRDLIGTLLHGTTFYDDTATITAFMNGASSTFSAQKKTTTGRAGAVKLSEFGNIDNIAFTTYLKPGGSAQVSYQHAVANVSLVTALTFDFSAGGMGGVFGFPARYLTYYDDMAGLAIKVA